MYLIWWFSGVLFMIGYFHGDILEMTNDVVASLPIDRGSSSNLNTCFNRIQTLNNKSKYRILGWYETYVLDRELRLFVINGGNLALFCKARNGTI